jgi:hypothetical protein
VHFGFHLNNLQLFYFYGKAVNRAENQIASFYLRGAQAVTDPRAGKKHVEKKFCKVRHIYPELYIFLARTIICCV